MSARGPYEHRGAYTAENLARVERHYLAPDPACECFDGGSTWHDGAMAWEFHLEPNPDCPKHFPKKEDARGRRPL